MSFKSFAQILILAILVCLVYSQQQFTGTATITNDPNMGPGSLLNVNVFYDSINQLLRFDYTDLRAPNSTTNGFTELYDFKNQIFYELCSVCQVYTNTLPLPKFFTENSDIRASTQSNKLPFTQSSRVCNPFQKQNVLNGGINFIWATDNGLICRAERTDGTTYNFNFTNTRIGQPAPNTFTLPSNSRCPTIPRCKTPIDLVLVLDESGSIHRPEWAQLVTFATGVVNSFVIGPNDTQIGLVYFSGVQYATGESPASCCGLSDPALNMNFDAATINKFLLTHQQTGGHTCINCGIKTAMTYSPNRNRPIQVPKLMLVLTDGFNNRMTDFFSIDIQNAKNAGWTMFSIGVANASLAEMREIASSPENVFKIDNFDQLETIAKSVAYKLCGAFPTLSPCGPMCKGKCGCGGQCICPKCVSPDNCTDAECVNGVSGSQCLFTPKFCDPSATNGDLCRQNVCDRTTGRCTLVQKNCTALLPDSCFSQTCDPKVGCTLTDSCPPIQNQPGTNTRSLCFDRLCVGGRCTTTPKNCTDSNACAVNSCDATLGCISTPINCDDNNMCTTDTCDKVTGCKYTRIDCPPKEFLNSTQFRNNLCLSFACDPKVGCTSTPKTCNDNNVCTTDRCDPATGQCVNSPITCPAAPNACFVSQCDARAGCIIVPKNCDDNNFCTIDTCNNVTGVCSNVPLVCPQNTTNTCTQNVCDSAARKCVAKPTTICNQPTNRCSKSSCVNNTCVASVFNCPPPDLCSTSLCDPNLGCIFQPKTCNDNNNCTRDSCDPNTGNCVNTPIPGCTNNTVCVNCTSTNPCITATCENGTCLQIPFSCPINLCATIIPTPINGTCQCRPSNPKVCDGARTVCGESVCNPATGLCGTVNNKVCDDNDPCTLDTCVIVNGRATCNYTQITCSGDSPCSRKKCVVQNGLPRCIDDNISNTLNCTSNDCATGVCNPSTGRCDFTQTTCGNPSNSTCARNICNPLTSKCEATIGLTCPPNDPVGCGTGGVCVLLGGVQTCRYNPTCPTTDDTGCVSSICRVFSNGTVCQRVNFTCDDNNPCTTERCVPDGVDDKGNPKSKCVSTPFVCAPAADPCTTNQCVNQNGKAVCVPTAISCNSTSKCLTGKCVVENGRGVCKYNETNCGTPDRCTNFICDPVNGCRKISKCNDGNPCTDDLCDPRTGNCTFTQKRCNSTSICQKGVCDPNVGCVQRPIDCVLDKNMTVLDKCHFAICSNNTGCTIAVVPNSLDACGFCNKPGKCAIGRKSVIPAGAIAGAVIGGAIIAGVIALGIGLFAASSGAAAFTPATQPQMMGGNNNPLYDDGGNGGSNPFDDNDYVPL